MRIGIEEAKNGFIVSIDEGSKLQGYNGEWICKDHKKILSLLKKAIQVNFPRNNTRVK